MLSNLSVSDGNISCVKCSNVYCLIPPRVIVGAIDKYLHPIYNLDPALTVLIGFFTYTVMNSQRKLLLLKGETHLLILIVEIVDILRFLKPKPFKKVCDSVFR